MSIETRDSDTPISQKGRRMDAGCQSRTAWTLTAERKMIEGIKSAEIGEFSRGTSEHNLGVDKHLDPVQTTADLAIVYDSGVDA